ncbi:MAG: DoxX family protein [Terriglobales bacterium]
MLKRFLSAPSYSISADVALLLLRLIVGIAFIWHGSGKIQNPFGWMGPGAFAPGIFQALAALAEFGGGILLVFGFLTRLGAIGIACVMAVAVMMHAVMLRDPFVSSTGGSSWELPATYFAIMVLLKALGPGYVSVDHHWFGEK